MMMAIMMIMKMAMIFISACMHACESVCTLHAFIVHVHNIIHTYRFVYEIQTWNLTRTYQSKKEINLRKSCTNPQKRYRRCRKAWETVARSYPPDTGAGHQTSGLGHRCYCSGRCNSTTNWWRFSSRTTPATSWPQIKSTPLQSTSAVQVKCPSISAASPSLPLRLCCSASVSQRLRLRLRRRLQHPIIPQENSQTTHEQVTRDLLKLCVGGRRSE